jgi:hypothetical protein
MDFICKFLTERWVILMEAPNTTEVFISILGFITTTFTAIFTLFLAKKAINVTEKVGTDIAKSLSYHNKTVEYEFASVLEVINLLNQFKLGATIRQRSQDYDVLWGGIYYPNSIPNEKLLNLPLLSDYMKITDILNNISSKALNPFLPDSVIKAIKKLDKIKFIKFEESLHKQLFESGYIKFVNMQNGNIDTDDNFDINLDKVLVLAFNDFTICSYKSFDEIWKSIFEAINNWCEKNGIDKKIDYYSRGTENVIYPSGAKIINSDINTLNYK